MKNHLLREARLRKGWSQQQLADFAGISVSTVERAERGEPLRIDSIQRLCECLDKTPEELGLLKNEDRKKEKEMEALLHDITPLTNNWNTADLWHDDVLSRGIAACQDLFFNGHPHQVEAILPLYCHHTTLLARQPSPFQQKAARLASQAHLLACELLADRENFGAAEQAGKQAFIYGKIADDTNLQVASLIGLANIGFHRKLTNVALRAYQRAISLLDNATPLLKGRTYAGIAEVYAMRGQFQESMRAMGLAYEHFPLKPEDDPAYPYLRASRYSLYVFGDAQSRLFLGQPKEAEKALIAMQQETNDPEVEPITRLDMLYYQAEIQIQQKDLDQSASILIEGAKLAKELGSRLYFNKLIGSYNKLSIQWPKEKRVAELEEWFQPWDL
ncbi:DNA-binding transcriptional regulator, XRE family [Planifilum fulgidum]|uniref:DNA-binding transcriptional regulator, XRE family n=1 Tax=Planifilum fulgidum TaxID=201973 RepID=A0A1I2N0X8_9BACL|nr:helix-turn-helix transcriptional regulator [Planifilum fulgidum]SFF96780.1 DNA-binding transcriptional regulator, XRE family [Planifilum fulgidum]